MKNGFFAFIGLIVCGLILFNSAPSYADCTGPDGPEGKIIYNADFNLPQICTGTQWLALGVLNPGAGGSGCTGPDGPEGKVIYNADAHVPQYCDGDDWRAMIGFVDSGGCTAPGDCPDVGDVCSDGSIFAGFMVDNAGSCRVIYVTDDNQSTSSQWKNASGTDDISTDDLVDGQVNAANRGGNLADFPAFDLCESNTYHSKSDWYLPARAELNLLWLNRAAIDANAAGNFTASFYWSSTEYSTLNAWLQNFGNGGQSDLSKTTNGDVRCVRRNSGGGGGGTCGVSNTGLAAYYKLDEASGTTTAADASGNGNTGALLNMTPASDWVTGKVDGALDLDDTDDYVNIPHSASLAATGALTISAWINKNTLTGYDNIISKIDTAATEVQYYFQTLGTQLAFGFGVPAISEIVTTNAGLTSGTWYHVAVTYDDAANDIIFYVNGVAKSDSGGGPQTLSMLTYNQPISLGFVVYSNETFDGRMDEVRIYNRVLSAPEIAQLYNGGAGCSD